MNPRLKKYSEKAADFAAMEIITTGGGITEFNRIYLEKYAEYILQDVLSICKAQKCQCSFQSYRDGINDVMHKIQYQYGVK